MLLDVAEYIEENPGDSVVVWAHSANYAMTLKQILSRHLGYTPPNVRWRYWGSKDQIVKYDREFIDDGVWGHV
jgi:hypothetical protein|tara:strand:+ start:1186 stop:1404 length:219 start_codon:yes stop_codon:yes gene_type:complete